MVELYSLFIINIRLIKMCNKSDDDYAHALKFVPYQHKIQEICVKAVDTHLSTIKYVPDRYETQDKCAKPVNTYSFVLDRYMFQKCARKLLMIMLIH